MSPARNARQLPLDPPAVERPLLVPTKPSRAFWFTFAGIVLVTALAEWGLGRLWLGPDGRFGWFTGDIWSAEQSQRVFDPYSFSHFIHGILFFGLLWRLRDRYPVSTRFLLAVAMEAAWEILENSPVIINRYRAVTVSLGYEGDSILNSVSDIVLASFGFWFAHRQKWKVCLAVVVVFELFTLWWVRDNLTLNILMLVHPVDAIRAWQSGIAPHPL